jgi:hypothetical protein
MKGKRNNAINDIALYKSQYNGLKILLYIEFQPSNQTMKVV